MTINITRTIGVILVMWSSLARAQGPPARRLSVSVDAGLSSIVFKCFEGCRGPLGFKEGIVDPAMYGGSVRTTWRVISTLAAGVEVSAWSRPMRHVRTSTSSLDSIGLSTRSATIVTEWRALRSFVVTGGAGIDRLSAYTVNEHVCGGPCPSARGRDRSDFGGFTYHGGIGYELHLGMHFALRPTLAYSGGVRQAIFLCPNCSSGRGDQSLRASMGLVWH
jgi:hypothetical protein